MDRLFAVKVFIEVVERGSLVQAAGSLDISHAMVSRYLAALEAWLGVRLLHRTTRKIALTEAGQGVLSACRQMLELADDVSAQAQLAGREPEGRLRVTAPGSFAEAQLCDAIIDFQQLYPRVEIELIVSDRTMNLVDDRIDLAIRISNKLDLALISKRLADCHSVLCAAPAYLQKFGMPISLDDLRQHKAISHQFVNKTHLNLIRDGQSYELELAAQLQTNETLVLRRAVLAGAGIAMLPTYYVAEEIKSGKLITILPEYQAERMGIHAVYLSRRHQPLALRHLLDFLSQRFGGELAPWDI